jgi:hypothetical protein
MTILPAYIEFEGRNWETAAIRNHLAHRDTPRRTPARRTPKH